MSQELLLVRHSERLDEIDETGWRLMVNSDRSKRDRYSLLNDPPITNNGVRIAKTAAQFVDKLVSEVVDPNSNLETRIYTSKLLRSVQTAHQIALKLNVPLYICSGLALTAQAVGDSDGKFEHLTVEEIQKFCPNVTVICCDDINNADIYVPSDKWLSAITSIANRTQHFKIIVAHRETIRNFSAKRLNTPYCCIARVSYSPHIAATRSEYKAYKLHTIHDMHGSIIERIHHPEEEEEVRTEGDLIKTPGVDLMSLFGDTDDDL
jgi:broad specificity phosphatase PhoE